MTRHFLPPVSLLLLFLLSACSSPPPPVVMPTEPDILEPAPAAEVVEETPPAPLPTPTPEPDPDFTLKIGNYKTSFAELKSGKLDKDKPVTVIMDPTAEYSRAVEVLTRVSDLGYLVEFQATP